MSTIESDSLSTLPLVSVVIPVYNAERYLAETINSILAQTYGNIEVIAVNDGSTDNSLDLLRSFGARIQVIDQKNAERAVARNKGIHACSGQYIAFLDADDVWDTNKIQTQIQLLENQPEVVATYCDHRTIDCEGKIIGRTGAIHSSRASGRMLVNLLRGNVIISPSVLFVRKNALQEAGYFDEEPPVYSEDYNMWLRLAAVGPILYQVDTMVGYRRHETNTYNGPTLQSMIGNLKALKKLKSFMLDSRYVDEYSSIYPLLQDAIYQRTLDVAWEYRKTPNMGAAINKYIEALLIKPSNLGPIIAIIRTMLPRRL